MIHKQKALSLFVAAAALGGLSSQALAAVDVAAELGDTPQTGKGPLPYAIEIPNAAATLAIRTPSVVSHQVALVGGANGISPKAGSERFFNKMFFMGGATFGSNSSKYGMTCYKAGAKVASGGVVVGGDDNGALTLGTSGTTSPINALSSGCIITFGTAHTGRAATAFIKITGRADVKISGFVEYWDGTQAKAGTHYTATLITFKTGMFDRYSAAAAGIGILSNSGSKKLSGTNTYTADLGFFRYGLTAAKTGYNISGVQIQASAIPGTQAEKRVFSVTVSGAPLVAASKLLLTKSGYTTCQAAANIYKSAAGAQSVKFSGISARQISGGMTVCALYDGTKAISEGQTYAKISVNGEASNVNPQFAGGKMALFKVTGSNTWKVLNIPRSNQSDVAFIRFYNNSATTTATVQGTLYNQDGTMVGTAKSTLATLAPLAATAMCGTAKTGDAALETVCATNNVETKVGGVMTVGRGWLKVDMNTDGAVQLLIRAPSGTLTNLSSSVAKITN